MFGMFKNARIDGIAKSTKARDLGQGTHSENCERCKHSVSNSKSHTRLSCTHYQEHVPANGKCALYTR